jgi:hypothetical protein
LQILAYLLARFSEPSSYAGLGAILALAGWNIPDPAFGQLVQLLAGACGLLALGLKERGLIRAIVLVFAVAPVLAGCGAAPAAVLGGLGAAGSAFTAIDKATAAATPFVATACGEYAKGKAAADAVVAAGMAPAAAAAKVTSIEGFGDAACASLPSGDPLASAIWLGQLAGQITTLTTGAQR